MTPRTPRTPRNLRVAVFGAGAVGSRVIAACAAVGHRVVVAADRGRADQRVRHQLARIDGDPPNEDRVEWRDPGEVPQCDLGVIALPTGQHGRVARALIEAGADVVSISDGVGDTLSLLSLDQVAVSSGRRVVVGAGFAPGLSCLLAAHAARDFDQIDEVHVAKQGTGGPACARQHHAALKRPSWDFREGDWLRRPGGSGRELLFFPAPVEGADCYRAELPDPMLLLRAFPGATRITARVAATRRDRFTSRLPMLRPPHAEGGIGAVRVEVWGRNAGAPDAVVYGVADHPAHAAAIVATETALHVATDTSWAGAQGLASLAEPGRLLSRARRRGLTIEAFEGRASWT